MAWSDEVVQITNNVSQLKDAVNNQKTALTNAAFSANTSSFIAANNAVIAANNASVALTHSQTAGLRRDSVLSVYPTMAAANNALITAQSNAAAINQTVAAASATLPQDLSGITAAALHRSPNAITSMFIYDTSKDSDGGAWTEKCQHTSWYNEPLMGKWLGAQASEAAARAVSGATTGDYFQHTTDGRFYSLNAASGMTEVFRGNKRDFPRLAGIVAEQTSVTIYDLTEPGRPMWMRFNGGTGSVVAYGTAINSVVVLNGEMIVGSAASQGLSRISFFEKDYMLIQGGGHYVVPGRGFLVNRNSGVAWPNIVSAEPRIANSTVNAVAMTVLPDAPVDPVTGLRVPTIAVATAGGISVIQDEGVVRNSSRTAPFSSVQITKDRMIAQRSGNAVNFAANPGALGASFALAELNSAMAFDFARGNSGKIVTKDTANIARVPNSGVASAIAVLRDNDGTRGRGISAHIQNTHNTGWMTGDIRRCYMSDTEVGSVTGPELVTNGGFDNAASWTLNPFAAVSGGQLVLDTTASTTSAGSASQAASFIVGRTYRITFDLVSITRTAGSGTPLMRVWAGGFVSGFAVSAQSFAFVFTATSASGLTVEAFGNNATTGVNVVVDNVSIREIVADRSYKAQGAFITGTLTRAQLASGTSLVGYSGWSAANYLREPYSADLDFGTGEWTGSAWVNVPATLPAGSFPTIGPDLVTNGTFETDTGWSKDTGWTISGGAANANVAAFRALSQNVNAVIGKTYEVTATVTVTSGSLQFGFGNNGQIPTNIASTSGTYTMRVFLPVWLSNGQFYFRSGVSGFIGSVDNVSIREVSPAVIFDRSALTGPRVRLGVDSGGRLLAEVSDGTTTRFAFTSASYNTAQWLKARVNYTTDGTLAIMVNGREVAATRGAPLLTLNNASAVLTIGNSFALDAPFPGSIALLKLSATVPTPEQATFMYEQEKQLFRPGAISVLPDSGAIVDMAYDDATDRWVAISASNESYWTGLVRNSVTPVPAGSYTRVTTNSGVELTARSTTNPGVDVIIPPYGLREELVKRAEAAARLSRLIVTYDYVGGFTGNITTGSTSITSVANLTYPTSYIGAQISGTGIPTNAFITGVSGTTIYISAPASATTTGVSISFLDFILPVGQEAKVVMSAGTIRREGSTADYTRLFDGFKETIRFATAPGGTTWVQIQSTRAQQ